MAHINLEFISNNFISDVETTEFKKQLALKFSKFESEINRSTRTYENLN